MAGNSAYGGGGIDNYSGAGLFEVQTSIVADSASGGDCLGNITSGGYDLDDDGSCGFSGTSLSDTAPELGPNGLQDNGGPTQTVALAPGSPAIGAVDSASLCSSPDQRRVIRPTPCDMGAFQSWPTSGCPAGSYDSSTLSECVPADPGDFVASADSSTETACSTGTYQPNAGQSSCLPADPGSYVAATGATSESTCGLGTYQPNAGQSSRPPADPGSYVATTGATSESTCGLGTYQPNAGQSSCLPADPGSYVATTGATSESTCGLGTYQPNAGQSSCTPAPLDTYIATTGATAPTDCPAGTYTATTGSTSAAACLMVTVVNPGNQRTYANTAITGLSNTATHGILPLTWSATGLPLGLVLNHSTGKIAGTPTRACSCSVTLKATDADGHTGKATFTWMTSPLVFRPCRSRQPRGESHMAQ